MRERVFEPFTQVDSSSTRSYGGSGLGLALCRRLSGLMGGSIELDPSAERGSLFHVRLPLPPAERSHPPSPAPSEADDELPPLRVLLAEDAEENVTLIRSYLKRTPFTLEVATNGREAVERFAEQTFDVVLMDIQMPVMDGLEATRRIRALPHGGAAAILALTAHALEGDAEKSRAAGCDAHLTKPIRKRALIEAVARAAERLREEVS
jgi:CheY-like chemotaxis protein